jgi:hypothetical protein
MSSLIPCPHCQKEIVYCVSRCPYCAHKIPSRFFTKVLPPSAQKEFKLKKVGLYIFFISVALGLGSCGYYLANQPKATDWDLQGHATEWKGVQPYERDKIASGAWLVAGFLLIVFSPITAMVGVFILHLIDSSKVMEEKVMEEKE